MADENKRKNVFRGLWKYPKDHKLIDNIKRSYSETKDERLLFFNDMIENLNELKRDITEKYSIVITDLFNLCQTVIDIAVDYLKSGNINLKYEIHSEIDNYLKTKGAGKNIPIEEIKYRAKPFRNYFFAKVGDSENEAILISHGYLVSYFVSMDFWSNGSAKNWLLSQYVSKLNSLEEEFGRKIDIICFIAKMFGPPGPIKFFHDFKKLLNAKRELVKYYPAEIKEERFEFPRKSDRQFHDHLMTEFYDLKKSGQGVMSPIKFAETQGLDRENASAVLLYDYQAPKLDGIKIKTIIPHKDFGDIIRDGLYECCNNNNKNRKKTQIYMQDRRNPSHLITQYGLDKVRRLYDYDDRRLLSDLIEEVKSGRIDINQEENRHFWSMLLKKYSGLGLEEVFDEIAPFLMENKKSDFQKKIEKLAIVEAFGIGTAVGPGFDKGYQFREKVENYLRQRGIRKLKDYLRTA